VLKLLALIGVTFGFGFLGASPSQATPIGPTCGTCQGSIYEISSDGVSLPDVDPAHETFRVTLTIDTSGYTGTGIKLNAVAIKVSSMLFEMSLVDAPDGAPAWTTWMGGLNATGCSGSGSGFDCAYAGLHGVTVPNPTPYSWVFDLTMDNGVLFTTPNSSSIKARYVDAGGVKVGALVSENLTLTIVPEPSTALLVALGGSVLAARRSRRR